MTICKIDGCGSPCRASGWCHAHYSRWRRHGDPLGGRTSKGAARRYFDEIVLAYDGTDCLIWPFRRNKQGYGTLGSEPGKTRFVSRLVCERIYGTVPAPDHDAAHSCGKGHLGCVTKRHLSWKTPVENSADMVQHGTSTRGERHPHAKLTESDVKAIRVARGSQIHIADRFGVAQATISSIKRRASWAWLEA